MSGKGKNSITIANIITVLGIVLLLVFIFIGHSYLSGGETGWDILVAVGISALAAFLVWFLIKTKDAENDVAKWLKIEYGTLAAYILIVLPLSLFLGLMQFFYVNGHKAEIKESINNDINAINSLFEDYESFENTHLLRTREGLIQSIANGSVRDDNLNQFMESENIFSNDSLSIRTFIDEVQRSELLGTQYNEFKQNIKDETDNILGVIESWSLIKIAPEVNRIKDVCKRVGDFLSNRSEQSKLPEITSINGIFTLGNMSKQEFRLTEERLQFPNELQQTGFSFLGLIMALVIHLLVLFNYIMAHRKASPIQHDNNTPVNGIQL